MRTSETQRAPGAQPGAYGELETFCLFIGYPKSGHSLVGALLDAHADIVIAKATNPLALVAVDGMPRDEAFAMLLESSRDEALRGRKQNKYRYGVEGQWQGQTRTLRVLGDKFSDRTTKRIAKSPEALGVFAREVGVPLLPRPSVVGVLLRHRVGTDPDRVEDARDQQSAKPYPLKNEWAAITCWTAATCSSDHSSRPRVWCGSGKTIAAQASR